MQARGATLALTLLALTYIVLGTAPALAYQESAVGPSTVAQCSCHGATIPDSNDPTVRMSCQHCHGYTSDNFPLGTSSSPDVMLGPHGNYSSVTNKCGSCHTLHDAAGPKLLPAATVVDTCLTCHDGTAGFGVYGAIKAQTGLDPATNLSLGSHRIAVTNSIPGGDPVGGGTASRAFAGPGSLLVCSDCHDVHGRDLVRPFMGERKRSRSWERPDRPTSKLLRQQPTGASAPVADYGSDWCGSCHEGRLSGATVGNHPTDSLVVRSDPFVFRSVAGGRNLASGSTSNPQSGQHSATDKYLFGLSNYDFLIAEPRPVAQGTHFPICQQCHEDTRDVSDLNPDGSVPSGSATYVLATADGIALTDNPRFQNFPHETTNDKFLIETNDDLCLNCHLP